MFASVPPAGILRAGWSRDKAQALYLERAQQLHAADIDFRPYRAADREEVEALVRSSVEGSSDFDLIPGEMGGVVARDRGALAAALIVSVAEFSGALVVSIRDLVTASSHRGRGLGTVMLGLIWQITQNEIGRMPDSTNGNCNRAAARLYQRAGFTVLQAGVSARPSAEMPVPIAIPEDSTHPHLILRPW